MYYLVGLHYFLQLPPFRDSDPGSHSRHSSPPCAPKHGACLHFSWREDLSFSFPLFLPSVPSLVDSRGIVRTHDSNRRFLRRFLHKKKALGGGLELAKWPLVVSRLNHRCYCHRTIVVRNHDGPKTLLFPYVCAQCLFLITM